MASRAGINGAAIALIAAGVVVAYSGIRNATVADTFGALIKGQPVAGNSSGSFVESLVAVNQHELPAEGPGIGAAAVAGVLNAEILAAVATWRAFRTCSAGRAGPASTARAW